MTGEGVHPDLQDLGELPAVLELEGGLAQALQAGPDLLGLLLQGGLEVEAAQARLVFGNRQHLPGRQGQDSSTRQGTRCPTRP